MAAGEGEGPWRYKLLPPGVLGFPPFAVPLAAHRQAEYVVARLQQEMDWCHGVRIRWFEALGPGGAEHDPRVFVSDVPLRGCVDPDHPLELRLNLALTRRPPAQLIKTSVHEGLHCQQLAMGHERRLPHAELERVAHEVATLLCMGLT